MPALRFGISPPKLLARGLWATTAATRNTGPATARSHLRASAAHVGHRRLGALVHLLRRYVLDVRCDRPAVAEGILDGAEAVAPELILHLHQDRGPRVDRLLHDCVDILDVHEDRDARAAELLGRPGR